MPVPEVVAGVRGVPHLFVQVRETTALIGPLVVPGRSTCWRCVQIARADRDPCWPALAAQLTGAPASVEPADVSLCTAAASLAVMHALGWLDRDAGVRSAGGPPTHGGVGPDPPARRPRRGSPPPPPPRAAGGGGGAPLCAPSSPP